MLPKISLFSIIGKIECKPDGVHLISTDATKLQKVDFVISLEDMKKIQDYYFPIFLESKANCPKFIESLKKFVEENSSSGGE